MVKLLVLSRLKRKLYLTNILSFQCLLCIKRINGVWKTEGKYETLTQSALYIHNGEQVIIIVRELTLSRE